MLRKEPAEILVILGSRVTAWLFVELGLCDNSRRLILAVVLVLSGATRLLALGRSLGESLRELRKGTEQDPPKGKRARSPELLLIGFRASGDHEESAL